MKKTDKEEQGAFSRFSGLSKRGLGRAKNSIVQSSQTVKARLDLTSLKKEETRLMEALGQEVFVAIKNNQLSTSLFDNGVSKIKEVQVKIAEKEDEILHLGVSTLIKSPAPAKSSPEDKDKQ